MKFHTDHPVVDTEPVVAAPQPADAQPADAQPADAQPAEPATETELIEPETPRTQPATVFSRPDSSQPTTEPTSDDERRSGDPLHQRARTAAASTTVTWIGLNRQPPSVRDAWDMSSIIDSNRVPAESGLLAFCWWAYNRSVRLVLFAVILMLLVPLSVLLYCASRPSRGLGLILLLLLVLVVIPSMVGG